MTRQFVAAIAVLAALGPGLAQAAAPEPAKPVELSRYVGRWYEVARLHNMIEAGCEQAWADYTQSRSGSISVAESCRMPSGRMKVYRASAKILDPGRDAKMRLTFMPFVSRQYWVLDHAPDYAWAIVGNPTGKYLWLFSRRPTVSAAEREAMFTRARELGYDTSRLEYDAISGELKSRVAEGPQKAG